MILPVRLYPGKYVNSKTLQIRTHLQTDLKETKTITVVKQS